MVNRNCICAGTQLKSEMGGGTGKNLKGTSIRRSEGRGGRIMTDKDMGGLLKSRRDGKGRRNVVVSGSSRRGKVG